MYKTMNVVFAASYVNQLNQLTKHVYEYVVKDRTPLAQSCLIGHLTFTLLLSNSYKASFKIFQWITLHKQCHCLLVNTYMKM